MAEQVVESNEIEQLKSRVEKLCDAIESEADGNLPGMDDLEKIREVLMDIKGKLTRDDNGDKDTHLLPPSKREELSNLLPTIERALEQHRPAADMPSAVGCYPCKPRPSRQPQLLQGDDDEAVVSLKLLLRLTKNVLEPEQYYEWTTSYVDESRIYGWDKEADEVADTLVGGDGDGDGKLLFRAAGIAGIHGSGKTALAQKVFVHDKAKDNFALRLWVCVGPPDSEDRFGLLYRMLDNLGLDTAKVEDVVGKSNVVRQAADKEEQRLLNEEPAAVEGIRNKAAAQVVAKNKNKEEGSVAAAGAQDEEEERVFKEMLKEKVGDSAAVEKSKIGVLLYILHTTLSKTSYLIVFDDIRAYGGGDGWYTNLALAPPPEGEWGDRLGYGLPKGKQHRGAVLVTCRSEDDARAMVRSSGRVVRPPRLELDDAWKLFRREYDQAKEAAAKRRLEKDGGGDGKAGGNVDDVDVLLGELEEMKEEIVSKCLGLPVAIAEAAKGFAALEPLPDDDATPLPPPAVSSKDTQQQPPRAGVEESSKAADD